MDKVTEFQTNLFDIFIIVSYLGYFLALIGLSRNAPEYMKELDYYVKIYISLFLIWRFNMFRKIHFNEFDKKIVFSAGVFLFTTTAVSKLLMDYLSSIKIRFL